MDTLSIIFWIGSIIITVLVTWLATWFFSGRKKITVERTTTSVISNDSGDKDVEILYRNIPVEKLSHTKITIRNDGNRVVYKSDLASKKLVLEFDNKYQIYTIGSKKDTHDDISSRIGREGKNGAFVSFDFLEKNDEIYFELLHDSSKNPELKGRLIGGSLNNNDNIIEKRKAHIFRVVISIVMLLLFIWFIWFMFSHINVIFPILTTVLLLIMGIVMLTWIVEDFRTIRRLNTILKEGKK